MPAHVINHTIKVSVPSVAGIKLRISASGQYEFSADGGKSWSTFNGPTSTTVAATPVTNGLISPGVWEAQKDPSPDPFGDAIRAAQKSQPEDEIIPHPVSRPQTKAEIDALWDSIMDVGRGA